MPRSPSSTTPHEIPVERVWHRLEAIAGRPAQSAVPTALAWALKPAGVLIPVFAEDERPHILFTRRSNNMPTHRGEISFPGGGMHDGDGDLQATALRETHEELGIDPDEVRVIGVFDEVPSIAGFRVTPFVARIPPPPVPAMNLREVTEVIPVDLMRLFDERIHRQEQVERFGLRFEIHYYQYDEHLIWGLTGGLVQRLLTWLRSPTD